LSVDEMSYIAAVGEVVHGGVPVGIR
jgi:hypothetical protein